jgi:hypothetical protein
MPEARPESFRMGLRDGSEPEWHSVTRMYLRPFAGDLGSFTRRPGSVSRPPQ